MKNLIFGLFGLPNEASPILRSLRELTISWSRYGYQGEIVEAPTLDMLLQKVKELDYDFCLVQKVGHVIDEQWYPPCWNRDGFHESLKNHLIDTDFLVIGETLEDLSKINSLKDDCLLINMAQYSSLGQPTFEEFVVISAQKGLQVKAFAPAINEGRYNLATSLDGNFYQQLRKDPGQALSLGGMTAQQINFLEGVRNQTSNAQQGVFLFNIESYQDLVKSSGSIDAVFSVAAGFKANRILDVNGFDDKTEVVFYDYSKRALEIRKQIVEKWDGVDFPGFVKHIFKSNPVPATFYQLWSGVTPENIDWKDVNWFWEFELEKWGGANAFKNHWERYRELPHQYIHCNLLTEQNKLFTEISKHERPFLWWSNAFFTVFSNWYYTSSERQTIYESWIANLAYSNPHCRVNGSDHNNASVNGLNALEYLEQYKMHPSDELNPVKLHEIEIIY